MLFGVFLRQEECLGDFPIVEIGEIDTAVVVVVAAAGQHHPMAVARPGGVAVGIAFAIDEGEIDGRRVFSIERRTSILFQRNTNDVAIMVAAMETAILPYGKQQIAPVGADAWQGDGRAVSIRVIRARKEQVTRTSVSLRVYSVALGVKKDGRNEFVSTGYDFQNVAGFGNFVAGFTDNVAVK